MNDLDTLRNLVLAPYILKATALIKVGRRIGGNQFRHSFSTLGILLDYKYFYDSVLLKASLLHDFLEDLEESTIEEIREIDVEGTQVVNLVLEVTRKKGEQKQHYLNRILEEGSKSAMILKCADRISNLTDLHLPQFKKQKIESYLEQTESYILPMAEKVDKNMVREITDLIHKRRAILQ